MTATSISPAEYIALEDRFGAHNYHPLPVVLERGEGVFVWDVNGKRYFDFLSAYSAVNQGHAHPRILKALINQARKLTLTSRAFYNDALGIFEESLCTRFGYDKLLPMNTGAEAVETALKLCRKWAYQKKKIPAGEAKIIVFSGNFHGRTITVVSASTDPQTRADYGPFTPGMVTVPYNDLDAFRKVIVGANIAGVLIEPIQGEAGVVVPDAGYLASVAKLCKEHHVLFIADEIQTGLGRTGKWLACDHEGVRPDLLILGKALGGGMFPVSVVLGDNEVMECMRPGDHGSTFGGNPLACKVALEAVAVIEDEGLVANAQKMGELFREGLRKISGGIIVEVRGKGLMNAIVIKPFERKGEKKDAWDVCLAFMEEGLLAKPTHGDIIRLAPPLCIHEDQIGEGIDIISRCIRAFGR